MIIRLTVPILVLVMLLAACSGGGDTRLAQTGPAQAGEVWPPENWTVGPDGNFLLDGAVNLPEACSQSLPEPIEPSVLEGLHTTQSQWEGEWRAIISSTVWEGDLADATSVLLEAENALNTALDDLDAAVLLTVDLEEASEAEKIEMWRDAGRAQAAVSRARAELAQAEVGVSKAVDVAVPDDVYALSSRDAAEADALDACL